MENRYYLTIMVGGVIIHESTCSIDSPLPIKDLNIKILVKTPDDKLNEELKGVFYGTKEIK